jgi:hypothetical protein
LIAPIEKKEKFLKKEEISNLVNRLYVVKKHENHNIKEA